MGRDEIQASLKMPAWRLVQARSIQKVLPQCCALLQVSCACTYTWCWLFFKILQNEICKLARNLPLASFGSERVNMSEKRCKQGKSDWVLYIPLFNSLWKFKEMLATYMYVLRMCNIHYM